MSAEFFIFWQGWGGVGRSGEECFTSLSRARRSAPTFVVHSKRAVVCESFMSTVLYCTGCWLLFDGSSKRSTINPREGVEDDV